jgi:hypothetical protein
VIENGDEICNEGDLTFTDQKDDGERGGVTRKLEVIDFPFW